MTYLFEKRRAGQKPGCSLQEPSPLPPRAKPRPENALDQKLSCSLQDFGFGPADPCGPGSYGCAQRPRDGNRGRPWCSWDARRAISSGYPSCYTQSDQGGIWKVENCTRNSGSNEVAISLLSGLKRPRGTSNQILKTPDLETAVEYLPASLPSSLSRPPPLTAAGSCPSGVMTIPKGGSIGSVQLRRKWRPFSPSPTDSG